MRLVPLQVFDKNYMRHKKWLPNQIRKEMWLACTSIPVMSVPTCAIFLAEVRGHSKLYDRMDEHGWPFYFLTLFAFLAFNDFCIYWVHRALHTPFLYKHIHKPHHRVRLNVFERARK